MNDSVVNLCGATAANGNPCRRACAAGYTRCNLHGGHTPLARQAAQEALARAALPSARVHLETVARWFDKRCECCGYPTGSLEELKVVLRAAQVVLDRTGFHPTVALQAAPQSEIDYESMTDDELAARAEKMFAVLRAARQFRLPVRADAVPVEGQDADSE